METQINFGDLPPYLTYAIDALKIQAYSIYFYGLFFVVVVA
jgi:hypothetical protein